MKIEFLGAAHEVTGSCHYLEFNGKRILIDCGMEQGVNIYENQAIPVKSSEIDYLFVTHAHIDHSGLIPLLAKEGFKGQIFATTATAQLCNIMLKDSAHIQESEAEWKNRKAERAGNTKVEPLYTVKDAEESLRLFVPCHYDEVIEICKDLRVCFRDAGHLLGSSFIEMWVTEEGKETKIIFSGDLGNGNRALIRDPEIADGADYLLVESTYGDRLHETPPDFAVELAKILNATFTRGGNVVIPAFSVGRTQEMLYYLRRIKTEELLLAYPRFEVYVDSPLSVEATNIYNESVAECFDEEALELIRSGINPISFPGLKTSVTTDDSIAINFNPQPKVIISASGMCEAGRIRHHLKHNLWREESTVVFVGYQCRGTLGYILLHGAETVKLFGEEIQVKAQIVELPGISGHADRDHLVAWVQGMEKLPKHIFVVHGEDAVTDEFASLLTELTGVQATAPYSGDVYDLDRDLCIAAGDRKRVAKRKAGAKTSAVFDTLVAAGQRLVAVIQKNRGGANKDLKKFTEQINSLSDKWDRD